MKILELRDQSENLLAKKDIITLHIFLDNQINLRSEPNLENLEEILFVANYIYSNQKLIYSIINMI
jgi:hypothetical protein